MIKQTKNIVLITGSREGIGYQTALQMALRQWTVILADKHDSEHAKTEIIQKTSNENVFNYLLDLSCFQSVRNAAKIIKERHGHLNVLINNAGIFEAKEPKTVDNLDFVMQVNHFGPFLLTVLLVDLLKKLTPSRIIFLTSSGAFFHSLNEDALPTETCHNSLINYYNSKLCNMLISKEFAKRLRKYDITSNCLHPGMTGSNFLLNTTHYHGISPILQAFIKSITQSAEKSAEMVTFLATSKAISNITGQYFANYQASRMPRICDNDDYRKRVWKQAVNLVGLSKKDEIE